MTISQKLKAQLESYGMFPEQAAAVMELVKQAPVNESMAGRWDDESEGYPAPLLAALWVTTKRTARDWLAENLPLAWFRPMFDE